LPATNDDWNTGRLGSCPAVDRVDFVSSPATEDRGGSTSIGTRHDGS
jgi:hypothetical protein